MKTFKALTLVILVAGFISMTYTLAAQTVAYYSGTVKNSDNDPIENVSVSAYGAETVQTSASGNFMLQFLTLIGDSIPGDSMGTMIAYSHPDYETYYEFVPIHPGDSITGRVIVLNEAPVQYSISGTVTDTAGNPLVNAIIAVNSANNPAEGYWGYTNTSGEYQVEVNEGAYYVRCDKSFISGSSVLTRTKWYDNVNDFADASVLNVSGPMTDIDFTFVIPEIGSISGTVTDSTTHLPLADAYISVLRYQDNSVIPDSFYYATDVNGHFTIPAFEGSYYIGCGKEGYAYLYYDNSEDFFAATPVTVSSGNLNVTGIDFELYSASAGTNSLSGLVTDNGGNPLPNVMTLLIPVNIPVQKILQKSRSNMTDKTDNGGTYDIQNVPDGDYYLLFYRSDYAAEFYGNTQTWEYATMLHLNGNTHLTSINAQLMPLQSFGGEVLGQVSASVMKLSTGSLAGTLVSAYNDMDVLVSTGLSGFDGSYALPYLPNDEYTVKASCVGYNSSTHSSRVVINLSDSSAVEGVNFQLLPLTGVDDAKGRNPKSIELYKNYPNPFNPSTTISFSLPKNGPAELKVYNILGQEVRTLMNETQTAGVKSAVWDGKDNYGNMVPSGVYLYRLKAGGVVKSQKMVMLK